MGACTFLLQCIWNLAAPLAAAVRGGLRDARGGVGSGEGAANAAVIALRGDEAIHDPGGCREGGGGDGFAVQSGHAVIVSISDVLRACQAAVFGFRDIGREPAVLPFSARAPEDAPPEGESPPPSFRRWAGDEPAAAGFQAILARCHAGRCLSYVR